ncbi:MAG: trimeric intracellular cation channel family protein [Ilumatobacter sp.]|nr:trimeric intracellular cation channel family protein [Ilumatobacter sp.]
MAQAESATGLEPTLERTLDLVGVFVFAVSGALLAVRKGFELVGVTSLALVTALGGGVVRDLLLGDTPPAAFQNVWYLVVPLSAAGLMFVAHFLVDRRLNRAVLVFDAAGLALFCVTGSVKAVAFGVSAVGAVLIGVISAVGGGIIRDVLANEQPSLFQRESTLYAIPATLGAAVVVVTTLNEVYSGAVAAAVAIAVFAVRIAALHFGWRAPLPYRSTGRRVG